MRSSYPGATQPHSCVREGAAAVVAALTLLEHCVGLTKDLCVLLSVEVIAQKLTETVS